MPLKWGWFAVARLSFRGEATDSALGRRSGYQRSALVRRPLESDPQRSYSWLEDNGLASRLLPGRKRSLARSRPDCGESRGGREAAAKYWPSGCLAPPDLT